jgi:hypothetical protein
MPFFCFLKSNVVPKQDCTLEVEGMPRSVCLSNDDKYSICGTYGGKFYVFNTSTGELVADCAAHSGKPIRRIKFNKGKKIDPFYDNAGEIGLFECFLFVVLFT